MDNTILRMSHLTKKYGSKVALDDVNFEIKKGRIYGFIGENGAGKTTAIRAITGLTPIAPKTVELFGESTQRGLEKARRNMGCLVERPILLKNKTAVENLRLQQLLFGQTDDEKIQQILERVGLSDVKNKNVKDYSLGMKQRLGIAAAIMEEPDIILPDEPTNSLDVSGVQMVQEIVKREKETGATVILSCHDSALLESMCDEIFNIEVGEITAHYEPEVTV